MRYERGIEGEGEAWCALSYSALLWFVLPSLPFVLLACRLLSSFMSFRSCCPLLHVFSMWSGAAYQIPVFHFPPLLPLPLLPATNTNTGAIEDFQPRFPSGDTEWAEEINMNRQDQCFLEALLTRVAGSSS